jgi:hypothetical protein
MRKIDGSFALILRGFFTAHPLENKSISDAQASIGDEKKLINFIVILL